MAFTTFRDRRLKSLLWSQRPRLPLPNPRSDELKLVRALLISGKRNDDDDGDDVGGDGGGGDAGDGVYVLYAGEVLHFTAALDN
ncbi:hypothetical protein PV325_004473 [Microctonus aethiopoides]|nr:hypothetical protein PV325_004473 [Microctonus aethiopoides]